MRYEALIWVEGTSGGDRRAQLSADHRMSDQNAWQQTAANSLKD